MTTTALAIGDTFTREDIHLMFGGQIQTYLPHADGKVVCGCFDPSDRMNPNAPQEIYFGEPYETPIIDKSASMVFEQGRAGESIPVFLKRSSNHWEYVGNFLCVGIT